MRIFRDQTSLAANPALWRSIEEALTESQYFLLLACPSSAKSEWVQKEIDWWLQNRSVEKLLIALTDGTIAWDEKTRDFDWRRTTAISPSLQGMLPGEPLYADFRVAKARQSYRRSDAAYRSAILDIAAPLSGRSKDDLDGEDIRQHRIALRTAGAVASFIVVLTVMAGIGMSLARQRQKTAASRALASEAASHLDDETDLALLLSLEARRIADTVESRRSLLTALQRIPGLAGFLWGHSDAVTKAVISPDGQTVLSAGWDDRIVLWSVSTHQAIGQPIAGPRDAVGVAFSPDGSRFASAGDGMIVIWDTSSHLPEGEPLKYAGEEFIHVAFSPNGKMLAASTDAYGAHPARIVLFDVATHGVVGSPIEGSTFAFSPDDTLLAIAQYENLALFDLRTHRATIKALTGHTRNISVVEFSRNGAVVAAGSEDKTVVLWEVKSHRRLGSLAGHTNTVTSLLFNRSGTVLLSGGADGKIIRWDAENLEALDTPVKDLNAVICSIFLGPGGRVTAVACQKNHVLLISVNSDPALGRRIRAPDAGFSNLAFSPDGRTLVSSAEFGDVTEWDVSNGVPVGAPLSGHNRQVTSLAYAPDGKTLVSGSLDGTLIFWNMATHKAIGPPVGASGSPVWSLAWSPDGKTVVSGGDAEVVFWEAATHRQLGPPVASQTGRIWALAFSPDGRIFGSAGNDRVVTIWKAGTHVIPVKTFASSLEGHYEWLTPAGLSFSPDGTLLAASTLENSVTIWSLKSGQPLQPTLYGHTQSVSTLNFAPDGKILASGSDDGEIRLWDVETHDPIGILVGQQKAIKSVTFGPAGGILASAGEDESIIFWEVDYEAWSTRACGIANRNLTRTEWDTYLGNRPYQKTCPHL